MKYQLFFIFLSLQAIAFVLLFIQRDLNLIRKRYCKEDEEDKQNSNRVP